MSDFLDIIHTESKEIDYCTHQLMKYARTLMIVGNVNLSNDLFDLAEKINKSKNNIDNAVSKRINDDYNQSVLNSDALLKTCLVMSTIKK